MSTDGTRRKQGATPTLQTITAAFRQVLIQTKEITMATDTFIVAHMRADSVVRNTGFHLMLGVIEPQYTIPDTYSSSESSYTFSAAQITVIDGGLNVLSSYSLFFS